MAESEEELKSLLMRVKEETEKAGLNLNFHKTKIMASSSMSTRQIAGEKGATLHGTTDWFKIGKGERQVMVYLTYMKSTSREMPDWMNHKLKSRLPGEISTTLDMQTISL